MNVPDFKNMNEYSGLLKNEYLFGMNTLNFYKMIFFCICILVLVKSGCCQMSQTYLKSFGDH